MQDIIGQQNKLPGRLMLFMCDVGLIEWRSYPKKAKDQNLISSVQNLRAAFALRPSTLSVYLVILWYFIWKYWWFNKGVQG